MNRIFTMLCFGMLSLGGLVGCGGDDGGSTPAGGAGAGAGGSGGATTKADGEGDVRVRFIVATPELSTGTGFDVCYLAGATSGDYKGPLANGFGSSFSAPEITRYFPVNAAGKYLATRVVKAGAGCGEGDRLPSPDSLKGLVDIVSV